MGAQSAAGVLPPCEDTPPARAAALASLRANRISVIVCCSAEGPAARVFAADGIAYADALLSDGKPELIAACVPTFFSLLESALPLVRAAHSRGEAALVHCNSGMHRSASMAMGLLMALRGERGVPGLARVFAEVVAKRAVMRPTFWPLLESEEFAAFCDRQRGAAEGGGEAGAAASGAAAKGAPPVLVCVGGAGGIGSACSRLFVARGWRVAILDTPSSSGASLSAELGSAAFFHPIDVGSEASVEAAFEAVLRGFSAGRLDALVVMSASFQYGEVHTITAAQWAAVCAINVAGPALCMKQAIPVFRAAGKGAVVLTSSITANLAFPAFVPYSATKASLQQMARDVALDNGIFGIRVNCVAPGPIFTAGGTVAHAEKMGQPLDELCAELSRDVSLRRMGTPEECAKAVYFLASDDAAYITGTTLHVDGGFTRK